MDVREGRLGRCLALVQKYPKPPAALSHQTGRGSSEIPPKTQNKEIPIRWNQQDGVGKMAMLSHTNLIRYVGAARPTVSPRLLLWLAAAGGLTAALVLLTLAVNDSPVPSQDRTVLDWVVGRDVPGLAGFMKGISGLTSNFPALGLGIAGIVFLWLLGLSRAALAFAIVGGIVGVVAFAGNQTLGEIVGRSRPLVEDSSSSYPGTGDISAGLSFR